MTREIDFRSGGKGEIPEEDAIAIIQKQAKQRRDSIEQYELAGRDDLKQIEVEELQIIKDYLPEQLSEDDVRNAVVVIVAETAADGMKDMGRVMGAAMQQLRGKADGKLVQQIVREILSEK